MLNKFTQITQSLFTFPIVIVAFLGLTACDKPAAPELMKATKQFESDEIRDRHVAEMRINHMDALLHKRDETMYQGIRTEKHSLNACINCHVPETHNGEVLRHTNPEHFCSTCHGYVAAQLDCFTCHVDHPVKNEQTASSNIEQSNFHTLSQDLVSELQLAKTQQQLNTTPENQGESVSE